MWLEVDSGASVSGSHLVGSCTTNRFSLGSNRFIRVIALSANILMLLINGNVLTHVYFQLYGLEHQVQT